MDNRIFFNKKDAQAYIRHNKNKNLNIRYYDKTDNSEELKKLEQELYTLTHKDYFSRKKYIKCPLCKSKLNTLYLKTNFKETDHIRISECLCPVCKTELRKYKIIRKQNDLVNKIKHLKESKHIKYIYG